MQSILIYHESLSTCFNDLEFIDMLQTTRCATPAIPPLTSSRLELDLRLWVHPGRELLANAMTKLQTYANTQMIKLLCFKQSD